MGHFQLMVLYATVVSLFFSVLWRREPKQQVLLFFQIFIGMVGGAVALGWLMYFFPSGPPAPIP